MSKIRRLVFFGVGVCLIAAFAPTAYRVLSNYFVERRIQETRIVSAGGQRLASLFEGLSPEPQYGLKPMVWKRQNASRCGARAGLFGKLLRLIEPIVHAQGSYNCPQDTAACLGGCCGGNWANGASQPCGGGSCQGSQQFVQND